MIIHVESPPSYDIVHSVKTPCPNLKKLIVPASTAAITTILFPIFSDGNGFGGRACTLPFCAAPNHEGGHSQAIARVLNDCSGDVETLA